MHITVFPNSKTLYSPCNNQFLSLTSNFLPYFAQELNYSKMVLKAVCSVSRTSSGSSQATVFIDQISQANVIQSPVHQTGNRNGIKILK